MVYHACMIDGPKETARQKASRLWHNRYVQSHITIIDDTSEPDWERIIAEDKQFQKVRSQLASEVCKIFSTNNDSIINKYMVMLRVRKIRLLQEKLRRLKESEANE